MTWFQNAKLNASLLIFHKDSKIRRLCLRLAESPETLREFYQAEREGTLDSYSNENTRKVATGLFATKTVKKTNQRNPSKVFEDTVLVLIILSSILLAIDNPLYDPKS